MKYIRPLCLVAAFILMFGCSSRRMEESMHKGLEDELPKQITRLPTSFIEDEYDHKLSKDEALAIISDKFSQLGYDDSFNISMEGDDFRFVHSKIIAYDAVESISSDSSFNNPQIIDAIGAVISLKPNLSWPPSQILVTWDYTMLDTSGSSMIRGMRLKIVYGIDATKAEECVNLYKQNLDNKTVAECISNATTLIEAPYYSSK